MSGSLYGRGMLVDGGKADIVYKLVHHPVKLDTFREDGNFYILDKNSPGLPVALEGFLTVRRSADDKQWMQHFHSMHNKIYARIFNIDADGWSTWKEMGFDELVEEPEEPAGALPVGAILHWSLPEPPEGWLVRNGAALSRTAYQALFAVIGTRFGEGDGMTTFNLPDDRGLIERGWDMGRGYDYEPALDENGNDLIDEKGSPVLIYRAFGSEQGDAIRKIEGQLGAMTRPDLWAASGAFYYGKYGNGSSGNYSIGMAHMDTSRVVPTAPENRMKNRAYLPIIKYR